MRFSSTLSGSCKMMCSALCTPLMVTMVLAAKRPKTPRLCCLKRVINVWSSAAALLGTLFHSPVHMLKMVGGTLEWGQLFVFAIIFASQSQAKLEWRHGLQDKPEEQREHLQQACWILGSSITYGSRYTCVYQEQTHRYRNKQPHLPHVS